VSNSTVRWIGQEIDEQLLVRTILAQTDVGAARTQLREVVGHLKGRFSKAAVPGEAMHWVARFNHDQIYEALGYIPRADFEANHGRQTTN
jgi:hypothetical protein